ncbi:CRISPR-associated endonuclease Cas3'' [Streptomyces bohaiensis]|uniref:CRISPR-associated endonuclease Cas3 n=1 Tax=Streptomyces bohaiensis TaxID=1431344 RepID=A0ABX1C5C0_9ACTN|nr:CRISPR-associated endonuclease Cas3'' [Streptomyces bohaiensis]
MVDVRLCGKSRGLPAPYALIGHLIDTAAVCGAVWGGVLPAGLRARLAAALQVPEEHARLLLMFWAGLHDLGKIMPQFQDMILSERPGHCAFLAEASYVQGRRTAGDDTRVRHENATSFVVPLLFGELGYPSSEGRRLGSLLTPQVAQVLGGHHGRYPQDADPRDFRDPSSRTPELGSGGWSEERRRHAVALHELLGRPAAPVGGPLPRQLAAVVAGVVIVSDWIASQEHAICHQLATVVDAHPDYGSPESLRAHMRSAQAAAPDLVREAGLGAAQFRPGSFREHFPQIAVPYPLQTSVADGLREAALDGPGILLVTAPTGEGKTETALHASAVIGAAAGTSGLFFALPTQATANQMYGRLVRFCTANLTDSAQLTLLHGAADLYAPYTSPSCTTPPSAGQPSPADQPQPQQDGDEVSDPRVVSDCEPGSEHGASTVSVEAGNWLRGRGRGILAPVAVGTIDQALMAVLPLRRNALRHFGLAGKTVVVDEAHAFDAYTHALLVRLLEWLGALRVPVVLLSATLTGETARGLVTAYLRGARPGGTAGELPAPAYPGWMWAPADGGPVTVPAAPVGTVRARELAIDVRRVRHSYDAADREGRLAALLEELRGVAESGGCVAVICTTVAEAQQTYQAIADYLESLHGGAYRAADDDPGVPAGPDSAAGLGTPGPGTRLRLLHARFPQQRRADLTAEAERWFGKVEDEGVERPAGSGAILVATQVIEQSLDLDFDLVISDLAPMAMLLQRAGRLWRHPLPASIRPRWAAAPHMVVLAPIGRNGGVQPPRTWGEVYAPSLLQRTFELLERRSGKPVAVPGDVQQLVDEVYAGEFPSDDPETLLKRDLSRLADDMAQTSLAHMAALKAPNRLSSLHELTTSDVDEDMIRSRLGVDSVPVLPVYEDERGRWLDEACTVQLPAHGSRRDRRFTRGEVRDILGHVAPLAHGPWRNACGAENEPPPAWAEEPRLARVVVLPHTVTVDGVVGCRVGGHRITYDRHLGMLVSAE